MTGLNAAAKATLRDAGITQANWAREWFPCNGKPGDPSTEIGRPAWLGDACGCPDDRCIGYHHDASEDCGCLGVLLSRYGGPRKAGRTVTGPTAADVRAAFGQEWEIVLTGDGTWQARLTTSEGRPPPVVTAATLAGLVAELNEFISGIGGAL